MRAKDVMSTDLVTLSPGNSIRHAAEVMLERDCSGLPVVDGEGALVGILTDGDMLRRCELGTALPTSQVQDVQDDDAVQAFARRNAWCVADVMSKPLFTVDEEAQIADVAALFLRHGIRRVPVVRQGQLVGIISRHDLLKAIARAPAEELICGDDRIRISVLARLREAESMVGPPPDVTVRNGVVTLSGIVPSTRVRNAMRIVAETVHGIAGIDDRLVVETTA